MSSKGGTYTELTYEVRDDVGVIRLNRPEARNALTHTTYRELEDAVRSTSARCLVIITPAAAALLATDIPIVPRSTVPRSAGAWSPR